MGQQCMEIWGWFILDIEISQIIKSPKILLGPENLFLKSLFIIFFQEITFESSVGLHA